MKEKFNNFRATIKKCLLSISGHTYHDDGEYIHLHKEEVTRGALLFGAGLVKGVIVTGLINNANNGITIGKKR